MTPPVTWPGTKAATVAVLCAFLLAPAPVRAAGDSGQSRPPRPAAARPAPPRSVVIAPLSTLGSESTAAPVRRLAGELETALGQAPGVKVIGTAAALEAIKQARKPALRSCDGDAACLAELGKLVGADWVVYGEVGGLGDVQVVYLELIDVATGRELRSTTLEASAGNDPDGGARGAAVRLVAPDRFVGSLAVEVDVAGAAIYVDGKRLARSPSPPLRLAVGTHALRVTHPEFRDFVRFVDIPFDRSIDVRVALHQFPVVERDLESSSGGTAGAAAGAATAASEPAPWYRSWWAIAGFGAVVLTGAAITAGILADGTDADQDRPVDPPVPALRF